MNIDQKKIKDDLKKTAEEIKLLKGIFRETKQPRLTWRHFHEIASAKQRATLLCSIQAHRRGKIHLRGLETLEKQAEIIGDSWRDYEIAADEAA